MVGIPLKKLAETLGFENKNGRVFGDYKGYSVTLMDGMGYKRIFIGICLSKDDPRWNQILGFIETNRKENRIKGYAIHPSHIDIKLENVTGTNKHLEEFLDKAVKMLEEAGIPGNTVCWYCRNQFMEERPNKVQLDEAIIPMHSACVERFRDDVDYASREFNKEQKNYIQGFFGALIGGLVGTIPWIIVYLLGYFVGYLGLIIGFAAKKGYEILGGRPGKAKPWIVVIIVIFSVLVGQFIAENIHLYLYLKDEGYDGIPILRLPGFVIELLKYEKEYQKAVFTNVGIGLVFAFLGIFNLFRELKKEGRGNLISIKPVE